MLFAAPRFKTGRLEKWLRALIMTGGVPSLLGLVGVLWENMRLGNMGIVGYTLVALVVFLLLGFLFGRNQKMGILYEQS